VVANPSVPVAPAPAPVPAASAGSGSVCRTSYPAEVRFKSAEKVAKQSCCGLVIPGSWKRRKAYISFQHS